MLALRQFDELQALLSRADDVSGTRLKLEQCRDQFSQLLHFAGPDPKEKAALTKGHFGHFTLSAQTVQEALFLSQQLQLSEYTCAALLSEAQRQQAASRGDAEVAVILFYTVRASLLDALVLAARAAQDPDTSYAFRHMLLDFLQELFAVRDWQLRVFKEIDRLQALTSSLSAQLAPAPVNVASAGSTTASFDADMQKFVRDNVQRERNTLGILLHALATAGLLQRSLVLEMAQWLAARPPHDPDGATLHVLVALLAALDPTREGEDEAPVVQALFSETELCKAWHAQLAAKPWADPAMGALALLQWTLFFSHACQSNPTLEHGTGIWEETIERDVYAALRHDALPFLLARLLAFRAGEPSPFAPAFRPHVLDQVEHLTDGFITTMHQVLKKLKNKEEDSRSAAFAGAHARASSRRSDEPPRHDVATLFRVVEVLYQGRPDAALKFWLEVDEGERRLNAFLRWAADSKGAMSTAFLEMLAALACGERSAAHAHHFLSANSAPDGTFTSPSSWSALFGAVAYFAGMFQAGNQGQEIPPDDVGSLKALAHLLAAVVAWSPAARAVLVDSQAYRPLQTIFALVVHPIGLDLKGDLFAAVAAFCAPCANPALAADIARRCWAVLEQSQVLPTWAPSAGGRIEGGIVTELELVETPAEEYPATTAFLGLLAALLHKQPTGLSGLLAGSASTYPDHLGAPQRRPGLGPYLGFVVDTVFLRLNERKYKAVKGRWEVAQQCLAVLDNALQTVRLQPILAKPSLSALQVLLQQPGIELLGRFLRSGPLLAAVAAVAATRVDELALEDCPAAKTGSVLLALRILLSLFRLAPMFSELVVPYLAEQERLPMDRTALLPGVQSLDDALLQMTGITDVVPHIAALVIADASTDIPRLAVELLTALSLTRGFSVVDGFYASTASQGRINRLVSLLHDSQESERIADGVAKQLQRADPRTKAAILDLFIANLDNKLSVPNVAHWLLGFTYRHDPSQPVAVRLVNGRTGLAAVVGLTGSRDTEAALLEQAFRVLHLLCSHEYTSRATTRYLRTSSDFFVAGVDKLPFDLSATSPTDAGLLFHAQAWLLKTIALEINELVADQQTDRVSRLLVTLFNVRDRDGADDVMQPEQSLSCMLELLHALAVEHAGDPSSVDLSQLTLFPAVNLQAALTTDASGVVIYDSERVTAAIHHRIKELQAQGQLKTADQQQTAANEAEAILQRVSAENAVSQLAAARLHFLQGWNSVLDVVLVRAVSYFVPTDRYNLLLDLLETIAQFLDAQYFPSDQADCLSSAAVMLVTTLREEQLSQGSAGPLDRLPLIFKTTIRALLTPGVSTVSRGQLFCVLAHLLRVSGNGSKEVVGALVTDLGRLLQLACRDALFAEEVWQLVAFSFLDSLYSAVLAQIPPSKLLAAFAKHNFVQSVVGSLKPAEGDLIACLAPESESLNALYIYEAKLSFLVRVASTKEGADAITDAQALAKLGQCEFLNAPLFEDYGMALERDAFFPSVYQRYQQILLPTLQFLVAYASHLTAKLASDRKRELFAFVLAHKDAFISVLHQVVSAPSLKPLEQACMVLHLLCLTGPLATLDEFASASSFGGIHSAVLTMTGSAFSQSTFDAIAPATEQEEAAALDAPPGGSSSFEEAKRIAINDLIHGLLTYLYTLSNSSKGVRPVLTSDATEHAEALGRYPSLASCLAFIRKQTHHLTRYLNELGQLADPARAGSALQANIVNSLQFIELALLLFLRHTQYYFSASEVAQQRAPQLNTAQAKAAIQHAFNVVAGRLRQVSLTTDVTGIDSRAHELLLGQIIRCSSEALAN